MKIRPLLSSTVVWALASCLAGATAVSAQQTPDPTLARQSVDLTFNVDVTSPAYTAMHPRLLVDEAHFNVHTSGGEYKPFVVLGEASDLSAQVAGPQKRPMGMNYPGIDNRQLALNIMHWLSRLID